MHRSAIDLEDVDELPEGVFLVLRKLMNSFICLPFPKMLEKDWNNSVSQVFSRWGDGATRKQFTLMIRSCPTNWKRRQRTLVACRFISSRERGRGNQVWSLIRMQQSCQEMRGRPHLLRSPSPLSLMHIAQPRCYSCMVKFYKVALPSITYYFLPPKCFSKLYGDGICPIQGLGQYCHLSLSVQPLKGESLNLTSVQKPLHKN